MDLNLENFKLHRCHVAVSRFGGPLAFTAEFNEAV